MVSLPKRFANNTGSATADVKLDELNTKNHHSEIRNGVTKESSRNLGKLTGCCKLKRYENKRATLQNCDQ